MPIPGSGSERGGTAVWGCLFVVYQPVLRSSLVLVSPCISTSGYVIAEYTFNLVCICGAFIHCLQYLEILSGTRLIKPAAVGNPSSPRERGVATPEKSEGPAETDSCVQFPKVGIEFQNNIQNVFMIYNYILKLEYK